MAWLYQAQTATKGIQLGNEEWCQKLSIGTNWSKVRIGIRGFVNAYQDFTGPVTGGFVLGMTAGTSNIYRSPDCAEFIGYVLGNPTTSQFTFTTGALPYAANPRPNLVTRLNGVSTQRATFSQFAYFSALNTVRTTAYVDIIKNSATSWTITAWQAGSAANAQTDNSFTTFMQSMENNTTPLNIGSQGSQTFTYDGPGLFDSMYVSWGKSIPTLTIMEFCACRIL